MILTLLLHNKNRTTIPLVLWHMDYGKCGDESRGWVGVVGCVGGCCLHMLHLKYVNI